MSNKILTTEGWQQRILDKIGVDAAYLPFSVIEQPDIISVAEANIIKHVPNYASLAGDDLVYLEAAVVCECANLLCPSMPARLPSKEQGPSESHEISIDWNQKKENFEMERDGNIGNISTVSLSTFLHFGLTRPRRC
jgi:hypothetical protein